MTALAALGAAAVDHELHRKASDLFDRSVYRGTTHQRAVALTFDDGPGPQTRPLLDFLEREQIHATFFQTGMNVERYPEIAREVHAAGHEIGNHGYSHTRLSPEFVGKVWIPSPRFIYRELTTTQRLLQDTVGTSPTLFRPPYGARWPVLDAVQQRLGLRAIQWTVIGNDWKWPADQIAERVLSRCVPGAIVCLHDGRDVQPTADISEMLGALRRIVPALRDEGFTFATTTDLLMPESLFDAGGAS